MDRPSTRPGVGEPVGGPRLHGHLDPAVERANRRNRGRLLYDGPVRWKRRADRRLVHLEVPRPRRGRPQRAGEALRAGSRPVRLVRGRARSRLRSLRLLRRGQGVGGLGVARRQQPDLHARAGWRDERAERPGVRGGRLGASRVGPDALSDPRGLEVPDESHAGERDGSDRRRGRPARRRLGGPPGNRNVLARPARDDAGHPRGEGGRGRRRRGRRSADPVDAVRRDRDLARVPERRFRHRRGGVLPLRDGNVDRRGRPDARGPGPPGRLAGPPGRAALRPPAGLLPRRRGGRPGFSRPWAETSRRSWRSARRSRRRWTRRPPSARMAVPAGPSEPAGVCPTGIFPVALAENLLRAALRRDLGGGRQGGDGSSRRAAAYAAWMRATSPASTETSPAWAARCRSKTPQPEASLGISA